MRPAAFLACLLLAACAGTGRPASAAGWALYLTDRFDGSNLMRIDPRSLADASDRPLLSIEPSSANSFWTITSGDGRTIAVLDYAVGETKPYVKLYDARTGAQRVAYPSPQQVIVDHLSADGSRMVARDWPPRDLGVRRLVLDASNGHITC